MYKKQSKTVQFSNLSEDHKAEFLQFLIKNNICFQEGKQNCTAKIALKQPNISPHHQHNNKISKEQNNNKKINHQGKIKQNNLKERKNVKNEKVTSPRPLRQGHYKNENIIHEPIIEERQQLKTPTKEGIGLRSSSLSCKESSSTIHKHKKVTPKSVKPTRMALNERNQNLVSDYDSKIKTSLKPQNENKLKMEISKQKLMDIQEKTNPQSKTNRKSEAGRERPFNKYHNLFESVDKGRAVRWPVNILERAIQEIYDDIFTRNTQCLQTRNIDNALKTLNLSTFPQLIESYFFKKFKSNKLASTNLNNLLYSLSYHVTKTPTPIFLKTFEDFLLNKLQHEDILYYLFARNVLKKELRAVQRTRELSRTEGTYFSESIKPKEISRLLKGIIGRDSELLNEYKEIITNSMNGDFIEAYELLRILLDDFHERRVFNREVEESQCMDSHQLFDRDASYEQKNQELTFGEEHYDHSETYQRKHEEFWDCLSYSNINDSLFQLIMQKMSRKALQFLEILASDLGKGQTELQRLETLLLCKAESLTKAVFQMNKMKWLRELSLSDPTEQDMAAVQNAQIRLRQLREAPSGKDICQFCKSILTVRQLVNELQFCLTSSE